MTREQYRESNVLRVARAYVGFVAVMVILASFAGWAAHR